MDGFLLAITSVWVVLGYAALLLILGVVGLGRAQVWQARGQAPAFVVNEQNESWLKYLTSRNVLTSDTTTADRGSLTRSYGAAQLQCAIVQRWATIIVAFVVASIGITAWFFKFPSLVTPNPVLYLYGFLPFLNMSGTIGEFLGYRRATQALAQAGSAPGPVVTRRLSDFVSPLLTVTPCVALGAVLVTDIAYTLWISQYIPFDLRANIALLASGLYFAMILCAALCARGIAVAPNLIEHPDPAIAQRANDAYKAKLIGSNFYALGFSCFFVLVGAPMSWFTFIWSVAPLPGVLTWLAVIFIILGFVWLFSIGIFLRLFSQKERLGGRLTGWWWQRRRPAPHEQTATAQEGE
jgi:hypothetical protein